MSHNLPDIIEESSEQQMELNELQMELMREEQERMDMVRPLLMEQMGINPDTGELTEFGQRQQRLREVLLDRQLQAAEGELPVPSAVERDITEQEEQLRGQLRDQFGAGFETASPAIERLEEFRERANMTREQARRGELTTAGDLLGQQENMFGQQLQQIMSTASTTTGGVSLGTGAINTQADIMRANQQAQAQQTSSNRQAGAALGTAAGLYFTGGNPAGGAAGGALGGALGDIF